MNKRRDENFKGCGETSGRGCSNLQGEKKYRPHSSGCSKFCRTSAAAGKTDEGPGASGKDGERREQRKAAAQKRHKLSDKSTMTCSRGDTRLERVKNCCGRLNVKRVLGFKCDLKKCKSRLVDCSAGSCTKSTMTFSNRDDNQTTPKEHCSTKA